MVAPSGPRRFGRGQLCTRSTGGCIGGGKGSAALMARPAKAFAGVRRCKRSTGPFPPRLRRGPRLTPPAQSRSALPRRGAWMVGQGRGLRPQRASPRGSSGCPVTKAGAGAARFPSGRKASLFSPSPAHPYGSANPRHRSALVCLASSLRLTRIGGTRVLWRGKGGGLAGFHAEQSVYAPCFAYPTL